MMSQKDKLTEEANRVKRRKIGRDRHRENDGGKEGRGKINGGEDGDQGSDRSL